MNILAVTDGAKEVDVGRWSVNYEVDKYSLVTKRLTEEVDKQEED